MAEQGRSLDRLKGELEAASEALRLVRQDGVLLAIDQALLRFQEAEVAYHDALYSRAPGMSGDDRTKAAQDLRDRIHEQWSQSHEDVTVDLTRRDLGRDEDLGYDRGW